MPKGIYPRRSRTLAERFWSHVAKSDGCWLWTAARGPRGYGIVGIVGSTTRLAHRVSWALTHGPIPAGLHVLHRCDNPPCCNPDHLFLGTHAENMQDMAAKGRAVTKLTAADVWAVRTALAWGVPPALLARFLGVGTTAISAIRCGRTWAHLQGAAA